MTEKSKTAKPVAKPALVRSVARLVARKSAKLATEKPAKKATAEQGQAKSASVKPAAKKSVKPAAKKSAAKKSAKPSAAKPAAKKSAKSVQAKSAVKPAAKKPAKPPAKKSAKTSASKPAAKNSAKPAQAKPAAKKPAKPAVPESSPPMMPKPKEAKGLPARTKRLGFRTRQFVVYPTHGVGKITAIEDKEIAGTSLEMFVIAFHKEKMTLSVPTSRAKDVGLRSLSSKDEIAKAMTTLKGKPKVKKAMWSRRAQEYEQKINSGDLIAIAEVVRDLHRYDEQREQSYSERQLYELALERMTREVAAASRSNDSTAQQKIEHVLVNRKFKAA